MSLKQVRVIFFRLKKILSIPHEKIQFLAELPENVLQKYIKKKNIKTKVGNFNLNHILSADNVFATGTAAEIQLISRLNLKKFSLDSKIIKLLIEKYKIIKLICPPSVNDLKRII